MNWIFNKLLRNKPINRELRLGNQNEFAGLIAPNTQVSTEDAVIDSRPYKVYSAILNQVNADPPTAVVLENTLGTITFSYEADGFYGINSTELFTSGKTVVSTNYNCPGELDPLNGYISVSILS